MTTTNSIEVQGQGKPTCVAETLGLFFVESYKCSGVTEKDFKQ